MGEITEDMMDGYQCSLCGVNFVNPHGVAVLCKACWRDTRPESCIGFQRPTEKEL